MADRTYIDKYINEGEKAVISAKNLYDTILVGDINNDDHIYRIGIDDFFLKHRNDLESITIWMTCPERCYYQPKTLSEEMYGTTELWLSLLRINNMRDITEFHYPIIKAYDPNRLKDIISVFFKREKKL